MSPGMNIGADCIPATKSEDVDRGMNIGALVEAIGLVGRRDLNGRRGLITSTLDLHTGRIGCRFGQSEKSVGIKPANLRVIPSTPNQSQQLTGDILAAYSTPLAEALCKGVPLRHVLRQGFLHSPHAIPNADALAAELSQLKAAGRFVDQGASGFSIVGGQFQDASTRGRSDHVLRLRENEADEQNFPTIAATIRLLKGVAYEFSRAVGLVRGQRLTAAPRVQVACYPGKGTKYTAHQDVSLSDTEPTGRTNWRVLTVIAYANVGWTPTDGGHLRIHGATRYGSNSSEMLADDERKSDGGEWRQVWDVEPTASSMIAFDSTLTHEVMPAWKDRYALTLWVWCEEGDHRLREEFYCLS